MKTGNNTVINSYLSRTNVYAWVARILLFAAIPLILLVSIVSVTGREIDWSLWQLWLSLREGYFLQDPILYLTQQSYPHLYEPRRLSNTVGIVATVLSMLGAYYVLHRLVWGIISWPLLANKIRPSDYDDSLVFKLNHPRTYAPLKYHDEENQFEVWLRGSSLICIVKLEKSVPHIFFDSKNIKPTPFLKRAHKYIDDRNQLPVDGVSDHYFRIFATDTEPALLYSFVNAELLEILVKHSHSSSIELINDKLIAVYNTSVAYKSGGFRKIKEELEKITDVVNQNRQNTELKPSLLSSKIELKHTPKKIRQFKNITYCLLIIAFGLLVYSYISREADQVFMNLVAGLASVVVLYKIKLKGLKW